MDTFTSAVVSEFIAGVLVLYISPASIHMTIVSLLSYLETV